MLVLSRRPASADVHATSTVFVPPQPKCQNN